MSDLLNQASLVMIPSGYKEDTVFSQIPQDGSGDLSFARASNGTRVNSAGLVEVCPWNLCTYSEQFQNADWLGGGNGKPTMTDNFAEAPNGTMTASKMEAASDGYQLRQNNAQENTQMNLSVWLRTNTGTKTIQLFMNNASTASQNITVTTTWTRYEISGLVTTLAGSGRNGLNTLEALTSSNYILVWGFQLSVGLTAKPYFPTTDRLNVPRLTYQNGGGGCPSLLLEKQSTNLALYSQDISNTSGSAWGDGSSGGTATLTANYATSPDGTQNATRIQLNEGSLYAVWQQVIATTSGTTYTYSIWLKAVSGTPTIVWIYDGTANRNITLTNEWVRYTWTFTGGTIQISRFGVWSGVWGTSSTADILAWGAQLEASSYPTSYIPTTSSSATRVADACFKTGISSLIGQSQGTMFVDSVLTHSATTNEYLIQVSESASNRFFIYREAGTNKLGCFARVGSTTIYTQLTSGAITGRVKAVFTYQSGSFAFYVNGTQIGVSTATFSTPPTMDRLDIDSNAGAENGYYNYNEAILFKTRLTNAELQAITTI